LEPSIGLIDSLNLRTKTYLLRLPTAVFLTLTSFIQYELYNVF
jgi:hypothetical protein